MFQQITARFCALDGKNKQGFSLDYPKSTSPIFLVLRKMGLVRQMANLPLKV
jgi:hypothetical protein